MRHLVILPLLVAVVLCAAALSNRGHASSVSVSKAEQDTKQKNAENPDIVLRPGWYRRTIVVDNLDIPNSSRSYKKRIKNSMNRHGENKFCVGSDTGKRGYLVVMSQLGNPSECEWPMFVAKDGKIDGIMICHIGDDASIRSTLHGTFSPMRVDIKSTKEAFGDKTNGMRVEETFLLEWIGECT